LSYDICKRLGIKLEVDARNPNRSN
jgi:hypothetical protein